MGCGASGESAGASVPSQPKRHHHHRLPPPGVTVFQDPEFAADETSLGNVTAHVVEWVRVVDLFDSMVGEAELFKGEPILAVDGRYVIQFFDAVTGARVNTVIDDRIPCNKEGLPTFAQPRNDEAWVPLLEKAMAKYCGTYQSMVGGWTLWAFRTLTGYPTAGYMYSGGMYVPVKPTTVIAGKKYGRVWHNRKLLMDKNDGYEPWALAKMLASWLHDDDHDYIFAAATRGAGNDKETYKGLYKSHAYSILEIVPVQEGITLVQLRNPHGKGEWQGDWSDGNKKWTDYPEADKLIKASDRASKDDGCFWMQYETDFVQLFVRIDAMRFPQEGQDLDHDGLDDDKVYDEEDTPFDEFGDLDFDQVISAINPEQVEAAFRYFDKDGNGTVSRDELTAVLRALPGRVLTEEEVQKLADEVDVDEDGKVNYKEFASRFVHPSAAKA